VETVIMSTSSREGWE